MKKVKRYLVLIGAGLVAGLIYGVLVGLACCCGVWLAMVILDNLTVPLAVVSCITLIMGCACFYFALMSEDSAKKITK